MDAGGSAAFGPRDGGTPALAIGDSDGMDLEGGGFPGLG
jgi:hypothetical protein